MSEAAPHGVKRKALDMSPGGEVRTSAVPMEENTPTLVTKPAWYDSPDMDEAYRFFLQHASVVNDKLVFKKGNYSITIGDHSDIEEDDATKEEEEEEEGEGEEDSEEEEEEEEEEEDGLPASG
jgi:hypothetical protein